MKITKLKWIFAIDLLAQSLLLSKTIINSLFVIEHVGFKIFFDIIYGFTPGNFSHFSEDIFVYATAFYLYQVFVSSLIYCSIKNNILKKGWILVYFIPVLSVLTESLMTGEVSVFSRISIISSPIVLFILSIINTILQFRDKKEE